MSRDKGKRVELELVHALKQQGWTARRVPLSGAAEGFKGDVVAEKDKRTLKFEVKARHDAFKRIYAMYAANVKRGDDVFLAAIPIPELKGICVTLSSSLEALYDPEILHYEYEIHHPLYKEFKRTFNKVAKMQSLLGEADILAIKDDRKPFLFIRYR